MRRGRSTQIQFLWSAIRAAVRFSDSARRNALLIFFMGIAVAGAAMWPTLRASANLRQLKSWVRLFGLSTPQNMVGIQPQDSSGIPGYTITTFDAPNAGTTAATGTVAASIDAEGDVAGTYIDSNMAAHGFYLPANGSMTTFDVPGDGSGATQGTMAISMDSEGNYIAGMYADSGNQYHGFLRTNSSGAITTFDVGNSYTHQGTIALSVNSAGTVAGLYANPTWSEQSGTPYYRGFVRTIDGTVSFFDAPDAGLLASQGTIPVSINNAGDITGFYIDGKGVYEGFVQSSGGTITEFQVPCQGTTCYGTVPIGIDSAGDVIGAYGSTAALGHGFLRTANGTFTTIDAPGAAVGSGKLQGTIPVGIDPTGTYITGLFSDSNGLYHGFVLTAAGTMTTFSAPGAATTPVFMLSGTGGGGVNASGAIVGAYGDANAVFHGMLLSPTTNVAATPSFSPEGGTYNSAQSVTILDTTPNATIYYTTDGSTPTTDSPTYSGPITVSSTETIEAIAAASGYSNSAVASATYTISAPGFMLSASPSSVSVAQGGSGTSTITVTDFGGFSGTVALDASNLPSGVAASFAAGSTAGTQVLTLTASTSAAVTSTPVTVTVTGTSGSLSATTSVTLTVTAPPFGPGSGGTTSITLTPGATTANTGTISVAGTSGFNGTVNLTCSVTTSMSNVNDMPTCSLNPTSVTLSGTTAQTSTLTVTTTAPSTAKNDSRQFLGLMSGGTALALAAFFFVPRRRRNWLTMLGLLVVLVSAGVPGCGGGGSGGGGGNSGTTAGAYTITVTGTSGTISATVGTVSLTVQ